MFISLYFFSNFYPRPPRGGRPLLRCPRYRNTNISIHALREEGDVSLCWETLALRDFYPRPPRGGRQVDALRFSRGYVISIHALREEGDAAYPPKLSLCRYFYPRPPRGGRQSLSIVSDASAVFLSTPSARRATGITSQNAMHGSEFLSTPSARRATDSGKLIPFFVDISIHALREEGDSKNREKIPAFIPL